MIFDINYRFPRAYIHRHKVHVRPPGFTAEGPAEIHYLLRSLKPMIETCDVPQEECVTKLLSAGGVVKTYPIKKIYKGFPPGTADNHFSGDNVLDFAGKEGFGLAGKEGFGLTMTCRKDRFPVGTKPYFHNEASKMARAKAMRFGNPIVA